MHHPTWALNIAYDISSGFNGENKNENERREWLAPAGMLLEDVWSFRERYTPVSQIGVHILGSLLWQIHKGMIIISYALADPRSQNNVQVPNDIIYRSNIAACDICGTSYITHLAELYLTSTLPSDMWSGQDMYTFKINGILTIS